MRATVWCPSEFRCRRSGDHMKGWSLPDYWRPEHPSQVAVADVVARIFETKPAHLVTGVDACGVLTYAFPLASIAKAYAFMIKHGSKMIQAVTSATVPQITIYCGASFGAGNYGMPTR